jgi:hypothetical protein
MNINDFTDKEIEEISGRVGCNKNDVIRHIKENNCNDNNCDICIAITELFR